MSLDCRALVEEEEEKETEKGPKWWELGLVVVRRFPIMSQLQPFWKQEKGCLLLCLTFQLNREPWWRLGGAVEPYGKGWDIFAASN